MIQISSTGKITVTKKLSNKPLGGSPKSNIEVDHQAWAKHVASKNMECMSVIVYCDPLRDDLRADSTYCETDYRFGESKIQAEARRRSKKLYPTPDQVRRIAKKMGLPLRRAETSALIEEFENRVYDAVEQTHFPVLLFEHKTEFEKIYREKHKDVTQQIIKEAWESYRLKLLLPTIETESKRIFDLPKPFNQWDERNAWQQWFIVDYGDEIRFTIGGSATSWYRECHGRWGHTFAEVCYRYHRTIPTFCLRYTPDNCIKHVREYEDFKVMRQDLTGNYPVDLKQTGKLFTHRLLTFESNTFRDL